MDQRSTQVLHEKSVQNTNVYHGSVFCTFFWRLSNLVVSMFDFHRSDRGSNPGRGGKIS